MTRICLVGPECTGKTELAMRVHRELGIHWVAEYAREYAEQHNGELSLETVPPIARGMMASLDRVSGDLVILDTDLISTVIYSRYYYGYVEPWIEEEARKRRADLYLLFTTDVPWLSDGARDASDYAREDLFNAFRAALDEFETTWEIVSGDFNERWRRLQEVLTRYR